MDWGEICAKLAVLERSENSYASHIAAGLNLRNYFETAIDLLEFGLAEDNAQKVAEGLARVRNYKGSL
jgi:hypothetical protein